MEKKEIQNGESSRKRKVSEIHSETITLSEESKLTLEKIKKNKSKGESECTFHDNKTPRYSWLHKGWVVEERRMKTRRVYKCYYDPDGNLYRSKDEVKAMCGLLD
ncbi:hypothetical protein RIF29_33382 [Crotalaria pallida]|uniref:MBD domain-containing protein n=1 Tax=Crotalaria pallida TaxID=3830 RepID=A0AAN9E7R5_CROPI